MSQKGNSFSKPEMVQMNNEYVFDESGGRGTPASTFFKRLAHKDHSSTSSKSKKNVDVSEDTGESTDAKVVGAVYSYADALRLEMLSLSSSTLTSNSSTESTPRNSKSRDRKGQGGSFLDLDDDWDANVDHDLVLSGRVEKSIENRPVAPTWSSYTGPSSSTTSLTKQSSIHSEDLYNSTGKSGKGHVKLQVEGIMRDPANSLYSVCTSLSANSAETSGVSVADVEEINSKYAKIKKFKKILQASHVNLGDLKSLAWNGIPDELRPMAWQLLLGYLPTNSERRISTLARKRKEYLDGVSQAFSSGLNQTIWHQISIDVPRTNPHIKLYGFAATQRSLERILYLWAIRHPASGYVQGINDLVTPFFQTFLSAYIDGEPEDYDPGELPKNILEVVEADSFWCLTKMLDGIQDNYIHAQPGIQRQVAELHDLTQRIDLNLYKHLQDENVEFMQFSFRWMNCLLMREVSLKNIIRMWDTYMAEGSNGFSEFHIYVCAAFLVKWSHRIQQMEFQEIMMFLQTLPTKDWTEKDIELLLSEAYMWQQLFKNASAHLRQ